MTFPVAVCLLDVLALFYMHSQCLALQSEFPVPGPICKIDLTASSTDTYFKEHNSQSIPSFMLKPAGSDRSTISLHFPG